MTPPGRRAERAEAVRLVQEAIDLHPFGDDGDPIDAINYVLGQASQELLHAILVDMVWDWVAKAMIARLATVEWPKEAGHA